MDDNIDVLVVPLPSSVVEDDIGLDIISHDGEEATDDD